MSLLFYDYVVIKVVAIKVVVIKIVVIKVVVKSFMLVLNKTKTGMTEHNAYMSCHSG